MQQRRSKWKPYGNSPLHFLVLGVQVVQLLVLAFVLAGVAYTLSQPMLEKAQRIQAREPVAENRPTWVRMVELLGLIPPYSELDRNPGERDPSEGAPQRARRSDARTTQPASRSVPVRTPTAMAQEHPLGVALTEAAREAGLSDLVVLDVDCGPTGEAFCIGWGMGSQADADIRALMRSPSFVAHRGKVAEWGVAALHWPSTRKDAPAFFALGIHPRKLSGAHRTDFHSRSAVLRERFEDVAPEGAPASEETATTGTAIDDR